MLMFVHGGAYGVAQHCRSRVIDSCATIKSISLFITGEHAIIKVIQVRTGAVIKLQRRAVNGCGASDVARYRE